MKYVRKTAKRHLVYAQKLNAITEAMEWCDLTFGKGGRGKGCKWRYGWLSSEHIFHFTNSKHATMFILRWTE